MKVYVLICRYFISVGCRCIRIVVFGFFRLNSIEAGRNLVSFIGDDVLFCQVELSRCGSRSFRADRSLADVWSALFAARLKGKGAVDPPFRLWPGVRVVGRLGFGWPSALLSWLSCFLFAGVGRPQAAPETCRFVKLTAVLRCLRGFTLLIESLPMTTQLLLMAFGAFSASRLALWAVRLANSDGATN